MIETKPKIATVDSCFELFASRQQGVAHSRKQNNQRESDGLLNSRGRDFGWAQIQTSVDVIAFDRHEQLNKGTEISCRCRIK